MSLYLIDGNSHDAGSVLVLERDEPLSIDAGFYDAVRARMGELGLNSGYYDFEEIVDRILVGEMGFRHVGTETVTVGDIYADLG